MGQQKMTGNKRVLSGTHWMVKKMIKCIMLHRHAKCNASWSPHYGSPIFNHEEQCNSKVYSTFVKFVEIIINISIVNVDIVRSLIVPIEYTIILYSAQKLY